MDKKLVLIDGHSILHRAFYGIPDLTNSKGLHTNAIYGFLNILFKILDEEMPEHLIVTFDKKKKNFRHEIYAQYKGTRKPMPEELREQVPVLKEVLHAMNIYIVEQEGYEADDLLGTMAKKAEQEGYTVSLVSGDRDLLQIASEHIKIRIPKTKQTGTTIEDYNRVEVLDSYGIEPNRIIDMKGLMGDTADNIPGVPGIGEKTALKILTTFESLENAYEHIEEVKPDKARKNMIEFKEQAFMSKTLATIKTDVAIDEDFLSAGKIKDFFTSQAQEIFRELEFKNFLNKYFTELAGQSKDWKPDRIRQITDRSSFQKVLSNTVWKEGVSITFECFGKRCKTGSSDITEEASGQLSLFTQTEEKEAGGNLYMVAFLISGSDMDDIPVIVKASDQLPSSDLGEFFGNWLRTAHENHMTMITSHLKEQLCFLPEEFVDCTQDFDDVAIGAYLINPLKESYGVDDLARDYTNLSIPSYKELFQKMELKAAVEDEKFISYAAAGLMVYRAVCHEIMTQLNAYSMEKLYREIEMPLVGILYSMESEGIRVKREALQEYSNQLGERIVVLEEEIYELAGEQFNINSPKQLGVILFEKLKLPGGKKTKTGYSTSADVLNKLKDESGIVDKILEYRQLSKLKSTYADGLSAFIEADGRIHGIFHQTVTATGRLSSAEPNLQNIPIRMEIGRKIRKVFVPKEGYCFIDADYSQIELRIMAHMSGDEKMIEAYNHEADIHRATAATVFRVPVEEVTKEQRSNAKAVNFGIIYGISSFGLSQDLGINTGLAKVYIDQYFDSYPKIKLYMDQLVQTAKEKGYVESMFHRIRPIPELQSKNFMQRSFGERAAMNAPIQGTAADIMKIAMIKVYQRLKKEKLSSKILIQVHDELLLEVKMGEEDLVKQILEEEMRHAVTMDVPLEIGIAQGSNWFEAK